MAITRELLQDYDVEEEKIKKIFGSKKEVKSLDIQAPNNEGVIVTFKARNEDQVASWLGREGAEVLV